MITTNKFVKISYYRTKVFKRLIFNKIGLVLKFNQLIANKDDNIRIGEAQWYNLISSKFLNHT